MSVYVFTSSFNPQYSPIDGGNFCEVNAIGLKDLSHVMV